MEMDEETLTEVLAEAVMDTLVLTGLIIHAFKQVFAPALLSKMVVNLADLDATTDADDIVVLENYPHLATAIYSMEIN
jgi:hypothetical protein